MLKTLLLASSVLIAVPALAQETPTQDTTQEQPQTAPATDTATPVTDDKAPGDPDTSAQATPQPAPAPTTQATQPTQSTPAPSQPAQTAPAQTVPQTSPVQPGTTPSTAPTTPPPQAQQPAATQAQVAQAVGRDFGTYDKDANGMLDKTEFGAWMSNLRKASDPAFVAGSPEATAWLDQAFGAADADKNALVNQSELATFLTPKAS